MAESQSKDLEFNLSEWMLDPFKGTLQFTVQKKIKITYFEFSTHDMGCCRVDERNVKYGLKLTLNEKTLFTYHNSMVDVQVSKDLILSPGNTYRLETWLGGHTKLKKGESGQSCYYHYAQILRPNRRYYGPFDFVFSDDKDKTVKLSNTTCVYIISYETVD